MIEVGDWIYMSTQGYQGNAFVVHREQDVLLVQIPSGTLSRISIHSVTKLDERLRDKDFQVLIDLALDLGDKKWFDELAERRREVMR
ncbi:IDEAL domain-containing protein [Bacillus haynesii]|uniref:IDEAL domain-containing protein n=1 Tax=Bacillus haynesii TaxID=1925021 RepID=UPI001C23778B|nr:IDEAL domain-containing protein [Bacillus haynesii]MBU8681978.1 IDEAL domain-containing protein [Bacillus haynesii]MCY8378439.1 IDEAL domain-containing protein [Bacillus haynesii]MCY8410579.1 IDEAL domain-containing protein [Bacillus haynesii]MCY8432515.1 IDEAL domain-containing protein [Bacillus haynesii]MCY8579342.1 IDEAL domain-containing protein [Bacillus haynesii]